MNTLTYALFLTFVFFVLDLAMSWWFGHPMPGQKIELACLLAIIRKLDS